MDEAYNYDFVIVVKIGNNYHWQRVRYDDPKDIEGDYLIIYGG